MNNHQDLVCKDHGKSQIDLTGLGAVAPLVNGRLDQLHMKRDGTLDDQPSLAMVVTIPGKCFVVSECSINTLSENLKKFGYQVTEYDRGHH